MILICCSLIFFRESINSEFNKSQCLYAGFDPTADSLHFGNLLVLTTLIRFLRDGHQVICLVGNATVQIGDPSDKHDQRPSIDSETVEYNTNKISGSISSIFSNHYKYFWTKNKDTKDQPLKEPIIVHNLNWYKDLNVIDFFSNIGRSIRLTNLLSKKFVENRFQQHLGLSYSEFSYQIFQSYDWFNLLNRYNCRFQIGGIDQIGNIQEGVSLIYKKKSDVQPYGLILPLILDENGFKYGKSNGKPVWLNRKKMSYFDFYQFFYRTTDKEVEKFLKLFTFLSDQEINEIMETHFLNKKDNYAQKILAEQITLLVHGPEGLRVAKLATDIFYKKDVAAVEKLEQEYFNDLFLPEQIITMYIEPEETTVLDVALKCKIFQRDLDTVKLIESGGLNLNGIKCTNSNEKMMNKYILKNRTTLVRVGKKRFYIIKWQ